MKYEVELSGWRAFLLMAVTVVGAIDLFLVVPTFIGLVIYTGLHH